MPLLLNQRQRQAIEHVHGPMLVIAGAGTGKTTVLVHRIAHLIRHGHARSEEILALTYTEKAAAEMKDRVAGIVGSDTQALQTATFHAYCMSVLQRAGRSFQLLDREDLWIYLRLHIAELQLQHFIRAADLGQFITDLTRFFGRCHDDLITPADYAEYVEQVRSGAKPLPRVARAKDAAVMPREEVLARCEEIARVYRQVEEMLASQGLGTFAHQVSRALDLLRKDVAVLQSARARARFILLDEFQDSNFAQIELAHRLAGEDANVFAVGDPDQAIYRFRGASSATFDQFLRRFPASKVVRLEENQRSTDPILRVAHSIIRRNPDLRSAQGADFARQPLRSSRQQHGEVELPPPVELVFCEAPQAETEAADIVERIRNLKKETNCRWSDFAVLYRIHSHRIELIEALQRNEVPFIVEGVDVRETTAVRDLSAVLAAINAPGEVVSLLRLAALPSIAIDAAKARDVLTALPHGSGEIEKALCTLANGPRLFDRLTPLRQLARSSGAKASAIARKAAGAFALDLNHPATQRFIGFISEWEEKPIAGAGSLREFLQYLKYFRQADGKVLLAPSEDQDAVRLMTVHKSKGLEWPQVFVLRVSDRSFPGLLKEPLIEFPAELDPAALPNQDPGQEHREEQRRLMYVAMTRARDTLHLYTKPGTKKDGSLPAVYVAEIMGDPAIAGSWHKSQAHPPALQLAAKAEAAASATGVHAWWLLPPRPQLKQMTLSPSSIESYIECPLRFKIEHDWRVPGEVAAALQFGSAIHTVLKHYFDERMAGRRMPAAAAVEEFLAMMRSQQFLDADQQQQYIREGTTQLLAFCTAREATPEPQVQATERSFTAEMGGVRVQGRVDRIDALGGNNVRITDYKTGKPKRQEQAEKSLQLSIYAIGSERAWKLHATELALHSIADDSIVVSTRTPKDLAKAEAAVADAARGIHMEQFDPIEPNPYGACGRCPYFALCPATEQQLYSIVEVQREKQG